MLMSDAWLALAQTHGITFASSRGVRVHAPITLSGPDMPTTAYDVQTTRALYPSRLGRYSVDRYALAAGRPRPLVIAESATRATRDAALEAGVSLLVAPEHGRVTGTLIDRDGRTHVIDASSRHDEDDADPRRRRSGRTPWGTYALVLSLLSDSTPRTQTELAREVSLSQPRVSQALKDVDAYISSQPSGWSLKDRNGAARWLADRYPRPQTLSTWLTLQPPVPATRTIVAVLEEAGVRYAVTGQVAADSYAPWALPDRTTIWVDQLVDLTEAGCTPAPASGATVTIAVPDDPYALDDGEDRDGIRLADPWRAWLTLTQDGDTAAADNLREKLVGAA